MSDSLAPVLAPMYVLPMTSSTSLLGPVLVVLEDTVDECEDADTFYRHAISVVTDGIRISVDCGGYIPRYVTREKTILTIGCGAPHGCSSSSCDDLCTGQATFDLSAANGALWRAATDADRAALASGEKIEVE